MTATTVRDPAASKRTKNSSSLFELLVLGIFTSVATFALTREHYLGYIKDVVSFGSSGIVEFAPLAARYGPDHYSRDVEEYIIRDYFKDRRNGVFLDVGANHYRDESNTYLLESVLGWSGVAVDALPEFGADYATHRPKTRFVAMFASDVKDSTVTFFVPTENKLVASADQAFAEREGRAPGHARQVPTTTLDAILDDAGVARLDFMSMDIELAEPKALAGFDIERFKPSFVCIESHPQVRQQILEYFTAHGYIVVGKYLRMDPHNLYFEPLRVQ